MKVLVACECSGIVRNAFEKRGHYAWSCDLKPCEDGRTDRHYQCDVREVLKMQWDLLIAHPDCTYLTVANNGPINNGCSLYSAEEGQRRREEAVEFFMEMVNADVPMTAVENPIGIMSTRYRKPDQIIQPWQFGDDASKATCLWLKGLPPLKHTSVLPGGKWARRANQTASGQNKLGPSPTRKADRSRTYAGIAEAMAHQWGNLLTVSVGPLFVRG